MNITFICDAYYPSKGGVQNVTKYLAEGLAKKNNVTVLTLGKSNEEVINNVKVKRFDIKKNKLKKYSGEIEDFINYSLDKTDDVTIFECTETTTFTILLPYVNKMKGKKILHTHGCYGLTIKPFEIKESITKTLGNTFNYIYWNFYYYPNFMSKYINNFDALISLHKNDSGLKYFNKAFKGKKFILGNAADNLFFKEEYEEIDEFNEIINSGKYVINVSNYRNIKNQLGILKQYKKSDGKYNIVFVGANKNKYYERVKKYAEKIKNGRVYLLTGIDREKIPYLIKNAELYIIGSKYEEFSISLIEAMALGTPFISVNVGNVSELPGGRVLNNLNELNKTINQVLKNPDVSDKLSKEAKEYAYNNCQIDQCVSKLEEIINEVI